MNDIIYDHYIAIDWSIKNMAVARSTKISTKIITIDVPSDIANLKKYLKNLKGSKIVVIEETTTAQWLYTELTEYAEKIVICDPYRNKLLNEGAKTDTIDAQKLVQLLKAGLVKEVYHTAHKFLYLRRLVSAYEDLVKSGVRLKNQRYALLRLCGKKGNEKQGVQLDTQIDNDILISIDRQINAYELDKKNYEKKFIQLSRTYPEIRHQQTLPGIGVINAVKIVARVVSPNRFSDKGHYLSYVGLIKFEKISGGKRYGIRQSRYCRQLKNVYKTGVLAAISSGNNSISEYYRYLVSEKKYPEYNARHKSARRLAILSFGIFKNKEKYKVLRRKDVREYIHTL